MGDGDEACLLVGSFSEMEYFVKMKQVGIWSNVTRNRAKCRLGMESSNWSCFHLGWEKVIGNFMIVFCRMRWSLKAMEHRSYLFENAQKDDEI